MECQQQSQSDPEAGYGWTHIDLIMQGKIRKLADHAWDLEYKELATKLHDIARNDVDLKKEDGFG